MVSRNAYYSGSQQAYLETLTKVILREARKSISWISKACAHSNDSGRNSALSRGRECREHKAIPAKDRFTLIRCDLHKTRYSAMANGCDMAAAIRTTIEGILRQKVPIIVCTDSQSLYDCLVWGLVGWLSLTRIPGCNWRNFAIYTSLMKKLYTHQMFCECHE